MARSERISHYRDDISELLGLGSSKTAIVTSILVAILSLFYIFKVAFYFHIIVYFLLDRVTYISTFNVSIINGYADYVLMLSVTFVWLALAISSVRTKFVICAVYGILAAGAILANLTILLDIMSLTTLPLIVVCILYEKKMNPSYSEKLKKTSSVVSVRLILYYIVIVSALIGAISIVIWAARILFGIKLPLQYDYAYMTFLIFSSFSPIYLILLVFCFPVKLFLNEFMTGIHKVAKKKSSFFGPLLSKRYEMRVTDDPKGRMKKRTRVLYLSSFIVLSIIIAVIPHQTTINPDNKQIGSDTYHYVRWINVLLTQSANSYDFVENLFVELPSADRPLTLLFLVVIIKIVNFAPFYVIEYFPAILGPSLVLTIYALTRELTSNEPASLLAAFLTATASFHLLVGIYAGYYANWLALIIGYLSIVFLFKALKAGKKQNILAFSLLIILSQFAHIYTWSVLAIVTGIFLGTCLVFKYYPKKRVILLMILLVTSAAIDLAKTAIIGSPGGIARDIQVAKASVGTEQLATRWYNLINTIQYHYGSIFASAIILGLGLYWLLRSNLQYVPSNMFLAIFLSIGVFPIFLGDWIVQSRIFYDIPFQIPAAIAITLLVKQQTNRTVILLPVCIWLIAISIRTASNLHKVSPS